MVTKKERGKRYQKKTKKKNTKESKINKLFHKYAKGKRILLLKDFKRVVKSEFHMNYHESVYLGALHMWGSFDGKKRFFTKEDFQNMFVNNDGEGFFRFIYI
mgnify:CR=1 FL=1|tara:strand:+ start:60 stop:365 length:306 start_codon:yes stop_codon:yes gene_type:complete